MADGFIEAAPAGGFGRIFRRFWPDVRPFRGWLSLSLVFVLVSPLLQAAQIWMYKLLVDDVLTPLNFSAFWWVAGVYAALTLVGGAVTFCDQYLAAWIGENFLQRMRSRVFAHLQSLSVSFFDRRPLGDLLSRLTGDVAAIESLVLAGVAQSVSALVTIGLFLGIMFYLNWILALVTLIAVPFFWSMARFFGRRIKVAAREVRQRTGSINAVAEESLGNAVLVQAYGREQAEEARFTAQAKGSVRAALAATRLAALFPPLTDVFQVVTVMTIIGAGVWQMTLGRITLGGLLVFLVYIAQLYGPVRTLGQLSNTVFTAAAGAERIIELLDQEPDVRAPADPVRLYRSVPSPGPRVSGVIGLEHVSFRYPDTSHDVLQDIGFTARPGRITAIVGASGAGKTTLLKLLLRFYDPTAGRITLDGHDLRRLDPVQLRSTIAIVLQETLLLDGTVEENILAGRPGATHADLVAAARAADADEFIEGLPEGYRTRVGQRGRLLSGGQRQRLAIARAMIRNAPVLLLDEPTTGLDAAAGARILTPLRRLMTGRTTIVISHNLLTVTDADQILYIDQGRVTEIGTHRELLANNDRYAHLYQLHQRTEERTEGRTGHRRPLPAPEPQRVSEGIVS
ncbi:ABC transporter ATP-binding protein/permease [Pseudonocardia sp. RS11V-5]|uniref:ABC transporter ATP-binding protein n=1 Tax=Pseudonocardia terrae TaxID=2905831 RepID=UPI001E5ECD5C|nr:ABC transporter ATP-binding protein [Pseudonocardia terrae]MCE3551022.1 ABC transporter ATP-binding protein/permease [Pseudonocardia terrae]